MIYPVLRLSLIASVVGTIACANAIPRALENTELFGNPRRNVHAEPTVPAGYSQPVEGEGSRIARGVIESEHRAEQDRIAATAQAREDQRRALIASARAAGCRGDDETCLNAGALREEINTACDLVESVKSEQEGVAYQHREAKKYGVVNLRELQRSKERAESYEDRLSETSDAIKRMRGRPFSARDCK